MRTLLLCLRALAFGTWVALFQPSLALASNAPGTVSHASTPPSAEQPTGHRASRLKAESVGYRIALANADRCPSPDMMTGLILHDLASYDLAVRPAIITRFGLGQGFGVLDVIPGSAADRAGFRSGDEIVALGKDDLTEYAADRFGKSATSDRVEQFAAKLQSSLAAGKVSMTVKRADATLTTELTGEAGCGGRIAYMPSGPVNAWSDGHYVAITKAMVDFARNDDELAFVIAHEMAHNLLHHAKLLPDSAPILAMFGIGAHRVKRTEIAADQFAVDLLLRTSFDPMRASDLFRRTKLADLLDMGITHPMGGRRIEIVKEEVSRQQIAIQP